MNIIRLVPKGEFELPITCTCGTQVVLEWEDFYIRESLIRGMMALSGTSHVVSDLVFPECPGCGRFLGPSEDHRRTIDGWNYDPLTGKQKKERLRVVEPRLQHERDAGNIDANGFLKPHDWREQEYKAKNADKLAESARKKLEAVGLTEDELEALGLDG